MSSEEVGRSCCHAPGRLERDSSGLKVEVEGHRRCCYGDGQTGTSVDYDVYGSAVAEGRRRGGGADEEVRQNMGMKRGVRWKRGERGEGRAEKE